ncbi:hypothetical protein JIR001_03090 [Polycladomyces abyssicola]|uniref:Uncharacterized protein n=1 Tax=Polycladomyces abyssicola TaxID=1125966 RepID=A0A8D5UDJ9_9BACL|nr:hypothetical protein [Polycladomyces abyssicola]BCU80526.1 hypothetical protein JIR001_03090 [Polycladomyces abyssicola]
MNRTVKYTLWALVTVLVEAGLTWAVARALSMPFEEIAFFIAVIGAVVVYLFSSQGGFGSSAVNLDVQASTGIKMEHEEHKVFRNPLLVGSIQYLLVVIGLTVVAYREHF